jgi:predicted MFS family arabinose efflux permease
VIPPLLRRRDFGRLWTSGLVSMTGDWVTFTGLPLVVYDLTGSTLATGGMLLAGIVPRIAFGSIAGVFVDRWDRRRILVGANLAHAVFLLPLLAVHSEDELWIVYAVAFVQATLGQLVEPAEGALLPHLVAREELVAANSLNALNNNLARLVGPVVGGVTVQTAGLTGVVVVDAVSFLAAAALVAGVGAGRGRIAVTAAAERAGSALGAFWSEWIDGLRLIARTRVAAVLLAFAAVTGVGEGVIATLIVPFVTDVLESGGAGYGAILSAQAVGGLAGSVLIARWAGAVSPVRLVVVGAVGLGAIDLVIFTYPLAVPILSPAIALMVVVGVPVAALRAGRATLEQTAVEDAYRGRLLGSVGTTMALAMAVGAVVGGTLGETVGIVPLLAIQSVAYAVAGLGVGLLLRPAGGEPAPES